MTRSKIRSSTGQSHMFPVFTRSSVSSASDSNSIDEIIVNAADNYQNDRTMNLIKVEIDPEQNKI